jgi:hypothetical protein
VLVMGGADSGLTTVFNSAELYDPNSGTWIPNAAMSIGRYYPTATLLPGGGVLVAGGYDDAAGDETSSAQIYNPGLGFNSAWQPNVTTATSPIALGQSLVANGSRFRGVSEGSASCNSQDSPADIPVLQLFALGNEQSAGQLATSWSVSNYVSAGVSGIPGGWALATIFVNGIPGNSTLVRIDSTLLSPIILSETLVSGGAAAQVSFTNVPDTGFTVLASSNISVPLSSWSVLGAATETAPGQYQFTDSSISNYTRRFYSVRSP